MTKDISSDQHVVYLRQRLIGLLRQIRKVQAMGSPIPDYLMSDYYRTHKELTERQGE